MDISYYLNQIRSKFSKDKNECVNNYYRKQEMCIGSNTHIFSRLSSSEPYLIKIGDHVTISTDVKLLTHDASIGALCGRNKISDICGEINIGNNTFIGSGAIIMYGVTVGERCIIAAGAVVTKSVPDGEVWGGNPAYKLGSTDEFLQRNASWGLQLHGLTFEEKKERIINGPRRRR